jgi:hypothetical protein
MKKGNLVPGAEESSGTPQSEGAEGGSQSTCDGVGAASTSWSTKEGKRSGRLSEEERQERRLAYRREWYKRNKEKMREYNKRYRTDNRDVLLEQKRQYYVENREWIKGKVSAYRSRKRRFIAGILFGCGCEVCGEQHPAKLEVHHLIPLRSKRRLQMEKRTFLAIAEEVLVNQILCASCHRLLEAGPGGGQQWRNQAELAVWSRRLPTVSITQARRLSAAQPCLLVQEENQTDP